MSVVVLLISGWYFGSRYFAAEKPGSSALNTSLRAELVEEKIETQNVVSGQILPNAYTSLLRLWSIDQTVTRQDDLCRAGEEVGLMCQIDLSLDIERLSKKRRPGVIWLVEAGDQGANYLLSSMDSEGFNLSNSRGEFWMSAEELASRWDGCLLYTSDAADE